MDNTKKKNSDNGFSVRKPGVLIYLSIISGIICSLFFCALTVLMLIYPNDTAGAGVFAIFITFILLGFLCIFIGFLLRRWEVHINGRDINYTPYIGKATHFTFNDISRVQSIPNSGWAGGIAEVKFYVGDKIVFTIGSSSRGFTALLSHLNDENIVFS